jgi:hypothetical protein
MSSAVHLLTVQDSREQRRQAVLRRYVRPELNAEEPDIAEREARAGEDMTPKARAAWRRASSAASLRLITTVPGWAVVHCCAVAGLVKCCT